MLQSNAAVGNGFDSLIAHPSQDERALIVCLPIAQHPPGVVGGSKLFGHNKLVRGL